MASNRGDALNVFRILYSKSARHSQRCDREAPQRHAVYVDSTISAFRVPSVYVDAVACCLERLQQLRQRLGVSHPRWRWMDKGCRTLRATVARHQPCLPITEGNHLPFRSTDHLLQALSSLGTRRRS